MAEKKKREFLVWTDDEVELLLKVTLDYKAAMTVQNVDWESVQSKYGDIFSRFMESYPSPEEAMATAKDFPHRKEDITKAHLTTKLKNIRIRYRQAVDTGRRNGHGRVIFLFFDACEAIWGGSPATIVLAEGVETRDLTDPVPSSSSSGDPEPEESCLEGRKRRLNDALVSHRHSKLRKKLTPAQQDLELRRRQEERFSRQEERLQLQDERFQRQEQRQDEVDRMFLQSIDRISRNIEVLVTHLTSQQTRSVSEPHSGTVGGANAAFSSLPSAIKQEEEEEEEKKAF